MIDEILLTVSVVTDDSTGIWEIGELEFGVKGTCLEYLNRKPENRNKLANWLEMLARKCRSEQAPFQQRQSYPTPRQNHRLPSD